MKSDLRKYLFAGLPLIGIGLLVNPWLLSWYLNADFSLTVFSGILLISILLIVTGWGIIYKKSKFIYWFGNKYKDLAVILLNLLVLFGLINFVAAIMQHKKPDTEASVRHFYSPVDLFKDSISFMRDIYPGKSDREINELVMLTAPYANHPVLEFQEKIQTSDSYNVGHEGVRYDQRIRPDNIKQKINNSIWVFGGSTTFGQGVKDDETIPANLNKHDTVNTYINFGVHAYHQSNEIDKLLLLLKKGYRPSKVIFIDGLNDIIRMIETNFHPLETPALAKSAYLSDFNIATKETGNSVFKELPVTRLLRKYIGQDKGPDYKLELPWNQYDDVYDQSNLYHKNPRQHFQSTILRSPYTTLDTTGLDYVLWKLKEMYAANYKFISHLSEAFGFEFYIFYQPLGVLSADNPFWKDKSKVQKAPLYKNFSYIVPRLRLHLAQERYSNFYDISDSHQSCAHCYVDLTHYNKDLNSIIASRILSIINPVSKVSASVSERLARR